MIANATELMTAVRHLRILEAAVHALREQLAASNPRLLALASQAYLQRIAVLQSDITQYLAHHPADLSLILPPLDDAAAAAASTRLES